MDAVNEFLLAGDSDTAQHAPRHLTKHGFHEFSHDPCLGVNEQKANPGLRRIALVQFAQPRNEVRAGVTASDDLGDSSRMKIEASQ